MKLQLFVVDAFSNQRFKGNSAAVVPVDEWLTDESMQNIAAENNLSETAFIKELSTNRYEIRWFSPLTEIDFCGHATLASAFVLFNELGVENQIEFITQKVGSLTVIVNAENAIEMTFPNQKPNALSDMPKPLLDGLSVTPVQVLKNRQAYFAVYASEQDVRDVCYDSAQLKKLAPFDVVVTAKAERDDFVSRYFWPANGGDEDPVTGSIHAGLAPYWAEVLGESELMAYQASKRGGILSCSVLGDRVVVAGHAVLYLKGEIYI